MHAPSLARVRQRQPRSSSPCARAASPPSPCWATAALLAVLTACPHLAPRPHVTTLTYTLACSPLPTASLGAPGRCNAIQARHVLQTREHYHCPRIRGHLDLSASGLRRSRRAISTAHTTRRTTEHTAVVASKQRFFVRVVVGRRARSARPARCRDRRRNRPPPSPIVDRSNQKAAEPGDRRRRRLRRMFLFALAHEYCD